MRQVQTVPVKYDTFKLAGGLDQVTPTLSLPPGVARDSVNFEVSITGGYSRISGYERFDGQPAPSAATYSVVTASSVTGVLVGDTVQNLLGTVTGEVIAIQGKNIVYTKAVGAFSVGVDLYVGASLIGQVVDTTDFSPTPAKQAEYAALAGDVYRADIAAVPGEGRIRGVMFLNDTVYAWRNNVGSTAMAIYKSSSSGWTSVALGKELSFDTGTGTAVAEGDTITNAGGTATGVVARVVLESGTSWAAGSGRLILSSTTGTWAIGDQIKVAGTQRATATSAASQITLAPNGRVETVLANMGGADGKTRGYGADGVNRGFEFDGTTYVPIETGMALDTPNHVAVHKNYLFYSFGASVQNSSIASPFVWSAVLGSNELVLPETVTNFQSMPGSADTAALAIYSKNNTFLLYGVATGSWNLVPYDRGAGAWPYTSQTLNDAYVLDDRGVMALTTSRNFGNFDSSALTLAIRPFMQIRRSLVTASGLNREKSQYRVFYSDGYGLYVTVDNAQVVGSMPVYFPNPVTCWCEGESASGAESSYFGSDNGMVYRIDSGNDFDGTAVSERLQLNFNAQGNARVLKRYRRASLEISGNAYASFEFGYRLGYDTVNIGQAAPQLYQAELAQTSWDAFVWDTFLWDGRTLYPTETECTGTAENICVLISSADRYSAPYTINTITLHYSVRRGIR